MVREIVIYSCFDLQRYLKLHPRHYPVDTKRGGRREKSGSRNVYGRVSVLRKGEERIEMLRCKK